MLSDPTNRELNDALAAFGRDLAILEDPSLGAREIPAARLIEKSKAWFASQEIVLRRILCTESNQVKPEIAVAVNLVGMIAAAIRAQYGDHFPASSAASALTSYGLNRFCAARPKQSDAT